MNLITRATMAATAADRWRERYKHYPKDRVTACGRKPADILALLEALPVPVDPDEVDRIIGNTRWTRVSCDACGRNVDRVVRIEYEDEDEETFDICARCIDTARRLIHAP